MRRYCIMVCIAYFMNMSLCAHLPITEFLYGPDGMIDVQPCETDVEGSKSTLTCRPSASTRGKEYTPLFIPNEGDPIMIIPINLIFIQKDDGTGNFQENDPEHQALFDDMMARLNTIASSLVLPGIDCYIGTDDDMVHDIRIRFIDHRYYVQNSKIWHNNLHTDNRARLCPSTTGWYLNQIDDSINNVLNNNERGINVYFTEDSVIYHYCWEVQNLNDTICDYWTGLSGAACSEFPSYTNLSRSSRIHMPCYYSKFWRMKFIIPQLASYNFSPWNPTVRFWLIDGMAQTLLHELGHSFYLYHPTDDWGGQYHSYPAYNCMESVMNPSGSSPHNFLPPQEIGLMYFSVMTTNLQQFIPVETYLGTKNINTTLSFPQMRMIYSLDIGSSGNVTMPCDIIFSSQCTINVQNGGILSIDGASLHSIQNTWGGIIVQEGGKLILSNITIDDYNITIKTGGSLIIQNDLTIEDKHQINIEDGGFICIDNNASINLVDEFSLIDIHPNAILGCPYSSCEDCILMRSALTNSGNGQFVTYEGTEYIQNTTIATDVLVDGNEVYAGYDVTNTKPVGPVIIENGGELQIRANKTVLTRDFYVELGGKLQISN